MKRTTAIAAVLGLVSAAGAQSTMDQAGGEIERNSEGVVIHRAKEGGLTLATASFYLVEPPEPRVFRANDLITVIVSERAEVKNENTLETDKSYDFSGGVTAMPDLLKLLELRWQEYEGLPINADMNFGRSYSGEGEQEVKRETTARVTARVVEVKPNGTMLLESKTSIRTDGEEQVIVISGLARQEDVTIANTVQSNQMANLIVNIQHHGELKRSSEKGLIPRAFDLLFNF
ncbi:MAG: flagellar basal body L-ring protein FlgH [bacterium]|nr:flagellar basal body L-ring protein FlgH [bacterium]